MICRFVKGTRTFDLASGRYTPGTDWYPPASVITPQIATGTAANRFAGGRKIGEKAQPADFSFTVRVLGNGITEVQKATSDLSAFLRQAGDVNEPLSFEYQVADLPEPLWGQFGAVYRATVLNGYVSYTSNYYSTKERGAMLSISLTLNPLVEGRKQRLANALGGIFEDTLGMADGQSRGLAIPVATTNKMTNPVFSNADWDNGWTTGANVASTQNTDPAFVGWGLNSAKLTSVHSTTNNTFTQSINAGNTNAHTFTAWVMRPDKAAVTASDCVIYYGAAKTSTYTQVPNSNIYKVQAANIAGINAGTATGLQVKAGRTVILLGFQMEEKDYGTPLAYGEMLGCAWSSTAHASTSTRTAGKVNLTVGADDYQVSGGAVAVVWTPSMSYAFGADRCMFSDSTPKMLAYYKAADDKFYLTDGTNTISSAAQNFPAGTPLHLVFTWGAGGLNIYEDGSNIATGATYTPPATPTSVLIGLDSAGGSIAEGEFQGVTIYDHALTLAEVQAIYNAAVLLTADGQRVDWIPWHWVKDGDAVVDNCNDATRDNWSVTGGIAGSEEAQVYIDGKCSATLASNAAGALFLSRLDVDRFINPSYLFGELSGTADGDCSGGEYKALSVDVAPAVTFGNAIMGQILVGPELIVALSGKEICAAARLADTSADAVRLTLGVSTGLADSVASTPRTSPTSTNFLIRLTNAVQFPELRSTLSAGLTLVYGVGAIVILATRSGSSNPIKMDFYQLLPRPLVKLGTYTTYGKDSIVYDSRDQSLINYDSATMSRATDKVTVTGDRLTLIPGKTNLLIAAIGDDLGTPAAAAITTTLTYNKLVITPRWSLV